MSNYRVHQYGLSQYGYYSSSGGGAIPGIAKKWKVQRSRLGIKLKSGKLHWVYQHTPVQIKENNPKIRLRSNLGETLYIKQLRFKGSSSLVRLSSPGHDTIYSQKSDTQGGRHI